MMFTEADLAEIHSRASRCDDDERMRRGQLPRRTRCRSCATILTLVAEIRLEQASHARLTDQLDAAKKGIRSLMDSRAKWKSRYRKQLEVSRAALREKRDLRLTLDCMEMNRTDAERLFGEFSAWASERWPQHAGLDVFEATKREVDALAARARSAEQFLAYLALELGRVPDPRTADLREKDTSELLGKCDAPSFRAHPRSLTRSEVEAVVAQLLAVSSLPADRRAND